MTRSPDTSFPCPLQYQGAVLSFHFTIRNRNEHNFQVCQGGGPYKTEAHKGTERLEIRVGSGGGSY